MHSGPYTKQNNLVFALDASSRRSAMRKTQNSNILPDPGAWSTGTGGQTGYGVNGSNTEQNRVLVTDDPWGRSSITWRTTPDATSGADGGWNTSYYTIDNTYTYRYSVWVRRYTAGTGGTFYMGMNPNPIRNDNGASQGNPYFTYPSISLLTQNQWYLVVAHVFYTGYSGGERHPDSGWYENGQKISDKSYGNVGSKDVRWASTTTSARHRAYHYYTTNVNSGIEFAYPRIDKLDGTAPTLNELLYRGESGWIDLKKGRKFNLPGKSYSNYNKRGTFNFDGTDDYVAIDAVSADVAGGDFTFEAVIKGNTQDHKGVICVNTSTGGNRCLWMVRNAGMGFYDGATWYIGSKDVDNNQYHHVVVTYDQSSKNARTYRDGVLDLNVTTGTQVTIASNDKMAIGMELDGASPSDLFVGEIPVAKVYNRILSSTEVTQNFKAYKNRFGIS